MSNKFSGEVFSGNFAGPVFTGTVDNRRGKITGGHLETDASGVAESLTRLLAQLRGELLALAPDTPGRQDALTKVDELSDQLTAPAAQQPERKTLVTYLFGRLKDLVGPLRTGTELITKISELIRIWQAV